MESVEECPYPMQGVMIRGKGRSTDHYTLDGSGAFLKAYCALFWVPLFSLQDDGYSCGLWCSGLYYPVEPMDVYQMIGVGCASGLFPSNNHRIHIHRSYMLSS